MRRAVFAVLALAGPASAGCNCWTCDGRPAGYAASCIGRSRGCDIGDPHGGCYGQQAAEPWHSGDCRCREGDFKNAELFSIHGTVSGLNPGHKVKIACSSPKTLGARFGNSAIMAADVSWDGRFSFPYKLARGQTYDIFVLNHPAGQKCSVTRSSSGTMAANVVDATVVCKTLGGGGGHPQRSSFSSGSQQAASHVPSSLSAGPKANLRAGECATYDEVSSLPIKHSPLPCKRGFDLASEHRDFQTEVKGHACVGYSVSASAPVNVCFVSRHVWDQLGRAAILDDPKLCRCKGQTSCKASGQKLLGGGATPYVLYVAPSDQSHSQVHLDVALSKCGGSHFKVVLGVAGAGLLLMIASGDKKKGGGGRSSKSRMAMHNRL
jgi:hypothetical protein